MFKKLRKIRGPLRRITCMVAGLLYFIVFLALNVKACSENLVKYGVWCVGAVAGHAFPWFFTVFLDVYLKGLLENLIKYAVLQLFI